MGCTSSKPKDDAQQTSPNAEPLAPGKEDQVIKRKVVELKIEITKASAGEELGVVFVEPEHGKKALHVKAIEEEGSIPKYNAACAPDKQVLVGDDIIEVDDISGDPHNMMQKLMTAGKIVFTVSRDSSKIMNLPVTALADPHEPTSEPAPEEDPEKDGAKGEEGAPNAPELNAEYLKDNEATPDNKLDAEGSSALKECAREGENAVQDATELTDVKKNDVLNHQYGEELLVPGEEGKSEQKDAEETLDPNGDSKVDQKDTNDALKKAIDAGEGQINVDPDEGETGPSATEARHICCW